MSIFQRLCILLFVMFISACVSEKTKEQDVSQEPFYLKELIPVYVSSSTDILKVSTDKLIASYRDLLTRIEDPKLTSEITSRVADLELLYQDQLVAKAEDENSGRVYIADYSKAIKDYNEILTKYPKLETNDRIYYQLAKAYDMGGQADNSLNALTQLTIKYPDSTYFVEAQFRRGDYLFGKARYKDAQAAYQSAVDKGKDTAFYENALYMNGWTAFKRNLYDKSLDNFTGVLDRTMPSNGRLDGVETTKLALVEDSLRIMGIVFAYMEGSKSIAETYRRLGSREYEGLLYEQLGDLLVSQQRFKDAIQTYRDYMAINPSSQYAPALHNKVLKTMLIAKFYKQSFFEKEEFIKNYDYSSDYYAQADDVTKAYIQPYLYAYIDEVARFYHTLAQTAKKDNSPNKAEMTKNYELARGYYEKFISNFPDDFHTPEKVYMIAEMYADLGDFESSIKFYQQVAYDYPISNYSEDAVYASILAYNSLLKAEADPEKKTALIQRKLDAQFALNEKYSFSKYSRPVMLDSIDTLYAEKDYERLITHAEKFLALEPAPTREEDANVSIILGNSQFEIKNYPAAEAAYQRALASMESNDARAPELVDRIAASVYKKAEGLYAEGDKQQAIEEFLRVAQVAPSSQFRKNAEYDAATYLLEVKEWQRAVDVLTGYRNKYDPEMADLEVAGKFLNAYEGMERFDLASDELTRVSALSDDPDKKRQALFLSAEYLEKAGQENRALSMYKEYLELYPQPFDLAMETRYKMSEAYKKLNDIPAYRYWLEEMIKYDGAAGDQRTDRSKYLAAYSRNVFAEDFRLSFESIKLTLPLDQTLPKKKEAFELALAKYQEILEYGVQEFTTQATFHVGNIYAQLSRDLMDSDRPAGLDELALEQYSILLEEEALPFEDEAIKVHESNVVNSNAGFYDKWVSNSIDSLAKLQPGRYNKKENQEGYSNAYH